MKRVLVVCEADGDQRTACELADRALVEVYDWLDGLLPDQRKWVGGSDDHERLLWREVKRAYVDQKLPQFVPRKHAPGPHLPDFVAARKALLLARKLDVDAVMLIRDLDDQPDRREGQDRAREGIASPACVVGAANPMREAWVLNGFDALDSDEKKRFANERKNLGLDPTASPEKLTAKDPSAQNSPKRVLHALTDGDHDREAQCWRDTSLDALRERGTGSGLTAFLEELRDRLAPLFGSARG